MHNVAASLSLAQTGFAHTMNRRAFLVAGGLGYCGLNAANLASAATSESPSGTRKARSTILVFLCGGSSHIDMWDLKPDAPKEFRGEFNPIQTAAPGVEISEHMPMVAQQANHLAIVRSLGHYRRGTGDHHAGYYYNLTGHAPDPTFPRLLNDRKPMPTDWPYFGSVIGYKRPPHPYLPQVVTLPQKPGAPRYTRPGQFSARLGPAHDPLYVDGNRDQPLQFTAPALSLQGDVSGSRLLSRRDLLTSLDDATRAFDAQANFRNYDIHQEKAFSLLGSSQTRNAFDVSNEPDELLDRYGRTVNGMSMLMARRLAEAGVPSIAVFWKQDPKIASKCKSGGGWDTHGGNFSCLKDRLLPEFDRCFSALLEDLDARSLLDTTLVMVNSEMGRKPKVGDPRSGGPAGAGRDHWTHCMSVVLAGGGIRGGQTYGTSDSVAEYPADRPTAPEDITKTVYHAMGIDDLGAVTPQGRPFGLLDEGEPLVELFG